VLIKVKDTLKLPLRDSYAYQFLHLYFIIHPHTNICRTAEEEKDRLSSILILFSRLFQLWENFCGFGHVLLHSVYIDEKVQFYVSNHNRSTNRLLCEKIMSKN
jgi:hypothetical protein